MEKSLNISFEELEVINELRKEQGKEPINLAEGFFDKLLIKRGYGVKSVEVQKTTLEETKKQCKRKSMKSFLNGTVIGGIITVALFLI